MLKNPHYSLIHYKNDSFLNVIQQFIKLFFYQNHNDVN